jgi:RNA polymerase sigma-70 factor (ECF subfamily)
MTRARVSPLRNDTSSDAIILKRVSQGDVAALGMLYDRYAAALLAYARRIDRNDAEDVIQTVFLRVMRIAPTFRADASSARPWLFAITTRVLQERTRALHRFGNAMMRLASEARRAHDEPPELRRDLQRSLMRLSVPKRTVLVLAEVEGFQCDEIAQMLEIPIGTVWTRLHHARKEMRQHHDERSHEE